TLMPVASQGSSGRPRRFGTPPLSSCLHRLLDTTGGEGKGRGACAKPSHRGYPPPRGASKAASTSQTTSHCPPEPSNLIGKFLGRRGDLCRRRIGMPLWSCKPSSGHAA